ncbi:MAG: peptidylprolyl isomerase [Sulfurimicrobium sp.]
MNRLLAILALALLIHQPALAAREASNPVLATVAEHAITKQDLLNYGRESPYLLPYLGIPGGPMRILKDMINERLLILEGGRLGIAQGEQSDPAFAYQIRGYLAPPCPIPDDSAARAFYDAHPEKFSTPLFLRLNRAGFRFSPHNEAEISQRLAVLRERLSRGENTFAAAAAQGDDDIGKARSGDLGFLPYDNPDNPVMSELSAAPIGQIVGPVKQQDMLYLYQVTARREPILAPYPQVRNEAATQQREDCSKQKFDKLFEELKQRWPVKMLVDEIDVRPEAK